MPTLATIQQLGNHMTPEEINVCAFGKIKNEKFVRFCESIEFKKFTNMQRAMLTLSILPGNIIFVNCKLLLIQTVFT